VALLAGPWSLKDSIPSLLFLVNQSSVYDVTYTLYDCLEQ